MNRAKKDSELIACAEPPNPQQRTPATPKIREARFTDYPQIASLLRRNGLDARSYDDWMALWHDNPALAPGAARWPIGWVLEDERGEVTGAIGNIPTLYRLGNRTLRAAIACDWAVDPAFRAHSLLLLSRLTQQKQADLLMCTTVSPQSEPAFRPLGWTRVPRGTWNSVPFWITNFRGFSRVALRTKHVPLPGPLSYPAAAALYCREKLRGAAPLRNDVLAWEIEPLAEFDSRFDAFWEELRARQGEVLAASRTTETLAWHFRRLLRERRGWLLSASRGGKLVAYAVFDRKDNTETGLRRVRAIDLQCLPGFDAAGRCAFEWMLRKCRHDGVAVVENLGDWLGFTSTNALRPTYRRAQAAWCFYYKPVAMGLAEPLKDPRAWHVSAFDGDICL